MRRRELIATAVAFGATGCVGPLADGDGGDDGPEATMTRFMEARDEGDVEEMNSLLHDDAELSRIPEDAELDVDSVDVEETDVVDEGDGSATVRVVVRVRPRSPNEGEYTEDTEWELRTQDGEWRIWNRTDGG
ncbi:MAG: hypothetical protein ACLFSW_00730 [Halobacteriales archaeon]